MSHVTQPAADGTIIAKKVQQTIDEWSVPLAVIESAHHGQPLAGELTCTTKLVKPVIAGMKLAQVGTALEAKQERAIASGLMRMLEQGEIFLPEIDTVPGVSRWLPDFEAELLGWTGRREETADQVDVCSYAANHVHSAKSWGGVITPARSVRRFQPR